ncbi:Glutathione S-transferase zeta class, partial [Ananas comosus]
VEKINPVKYVPALVDGDVVVADSFAIILYLEDKYPQNPLLPQDLKKKALNLQIASIVSSSIQPLRSLTVLQYIEENLGSEKKLPWVQLHINKGFTALEKLLAGVAGKYATGDEVLLVCPPNPEFYLAAIYSSTKPIWSYPHFKPHSLKDNRTRLPHLSSLSGRLDYEYKAVNLLKGEQLNPEFEKINPVKYVPALVDGDIVVADSFAIILYLEDKYPQNPLLPQDLKKKALNLQIASIVSSGIQPLQNLPVLINRTLQQYIEENLGSEKKLPWTQLHINKGFTALEKLLAGVAGKYATGDEVLLGDVFLAPQIYAGVKRFAIDMSNYPTLARLHEAYMELPAFQAALPERQPDAPSSP